MLVFTFPTQEQIGESVLSYSIPSDWRDVGLSPGRLLTIFSLSTAWVFFKATSFLSTKSIVYSLTRPKSCAFIAKLSFTAGNRKEGIYFCQMQNAKSDRGRQGPLEFGLVHILYLLFHWKDSGFFQVTMGSWILPAVIILQCFPQRQNLVLSNISGHSGQCFVPRFTECHS